MFVKCVTVPCPWTLRSPKNRPSRKVRILEESLIICQIGNDLVEAVLSGFTANSVVGRKRHLMNRFGAMMMIVDPERRRAYKREYYQSHKWIFQKAQRDYWRRRKARETPEETAERKRKANEYMREYNRKKRVTENGRKAQI